MTLCGDALEQAQRAEAEAKREAERELVEQRRLAAAYEREQRRWSECVGQFGSAAYDEDPYVVGVVADECGEEPAGP